VPPPIEVWPSEASRKARRRRLPASRNAKAASTAAKATFVFLGAGGQALDFGPRGETQGRIFLGAGGHALDLARGEWKETFFTGAGGHTGARIAGRGESI